MGLPACLPAQRIRRLGGNEKTSVQRIGPCCSVQQQWCDPPDVIQHESNLHVWEITIMWPLTASWSSIISPKLLLVCDGNKGDEPSWTMLPQQIGGPARMTGSFVFDRLCCDAVSHLGWNCLWDVRLKFYAEWCPLEKKGRRISGVVSSVWLGTKHWMSLNLCTYILY